MKRSKLVKISENINKNLKEVLDNINELIQESKKNDWSLSNAYSRVADAMNDIQSTINFELDRNREVEQVYGFSDNSLFDIEEDGGDK